MPSIIENTLKNGSITAGKCAGTITHYEPINNITVITDQSGKVITSFFGQGG